MELRFQRFNQSRACINDFVHCLIWHIITRPCLHANTVEPPLMMGCRWVNKDHWFCGHNHSLLPQINAGLANHRFKRVIWQFFQKIMHRDRIWYLNKKCMSTLFLCHTKRCGCISKKITKQQLSHSAIYSYLYIVWHRNRKHNIADCNFNLDAPKLWDWYPPNSYKQTHWWYISSDVW